MAYTIRIWAREHIEKFRLLHLLTSAGFTIGESSTEEKGKARRPAWAAGFDCLTVIELRGIRLPAARPWCGNHPGPCDANNPHARKNKDGSKPKSKILEAGDWIKVNNVVNNWLDSIPNSVSEAFTTSGATDKYLFVRREGKRRQRWDYIEVHRNIGVPLRLWLSGKPGGGIMHDFQFTGPRSDVDYRIMEAGQKADGRGWDEWEDQEDAIAFATEQHR